MQTFVAAPRPGPLGVWDRSAPARAPTPAPKFLLGAGSLETKIKEDMGVLAQGLSARGLTVEQRLFTGGHSLSTWNALFWFYIPQVSADAE